MTASNHLNCGDLTEFIDTMLDLLIAGQERILDELIPKMDATEKLTVYLTSHYKKIDYEFCISFQWINCLAIKEID